MTDSSSPEASGDEYWSPRGDDASEIETGLGFRPKFDADGLIAVIVVDASNGDIAMVAWMNAAALARTLETRVAHFWSRSRQNLWQKGEESGNVLHVKALATDCDQDVLLLTAEIDGDGVACHTGRPSCFYREVDLGPKSRPYSLRSRSS